MTIRDTLISNKRNLEVKVRTHREVLGLCIRFLEKRGYHKLTGMIDSTYPSWFRPDSLFYKEGEEFVDFYEIKPSNIGRDEIRNGFGQCLEALALGFRPYLVLSYSKLSETDTFTKYLPKIGIKYFTSDSTELYTFLEGYGEKSELSENLVKQVNRILTEERDRKSKKQKRIPRPHCDRCQFYLHVRGHEVELVEREKYLVHCKYFDRWFKREEIPKKICEGYKRY